MGLSMALESARSDLCVIRYEFFGNGHLASFGPNRIQTAIGQKLSVFCIPSMQLSRPQHYQSLDQVILHWGVFIAVVTVLCTVYYP